MKRGGNESKGVGGMEEKEKKTSEPVDNQTL